MIDNAVINKVTTNVVSKKAIISENTGAIFSILTESVYSDPVSAGIREVIANAIDARRRAKSTRPIDVKSPTIMDGTFSVRDYGNGLSHDEIYSLYTSLGESSKKNIEDEIGFFGIGAMSPFAYTDSFTVKSYQNGTVSIYSMWIGENGVPEISLVSKLRTEESDGLEVRWSFANKDIRNAISKIDYYCTFHEKGSILLNGVAPSYYKDIWANKQMLEFSIDDKIFVHRNGGSTSTAVMGGVPYEFRIPDEYVAKFSYTPTVYIDLPLGSVSIQASREKLKLNAKTNSTISRIFENIINNYSKICQEQCEKQDSLIDAIIYTRSSKLINTPVDYEYKGIKLNPNELDTLLNNYYKFEIVVLLNRYNARYQKYRPIDLILTQNNTVLKDLKNGIKTRVRSALSCIFYIEFVELYEGANDEFEKLYGRFIKYKASELNTAKTSTARKVEIKDNVFKIVFCKYNNAIFADCVKECTDTSIPHFFVRLDKKSILSNNKKVKIINIAGIINLFDKPILAYQKDSDIPQHAEDFLKYLSKNYKKPIIEHCRAGVYNNIKNTDLHDILESNRKDYTLAIKKFKEAQRMSFYDVTMYKESIFNLLNIKIDIEQISQLVDDEYKPISNVLEKYYPYTKWLNSTFPKHAHREVTDYILTGDQNVFKSCIN